MLKDDSVTRDIPVSQALSVLSAGSRWQEDWSDHSGQAVSPIRTGLPRAGEGLPTRGSAYPQTLKDDPQPQVLDTLGLPNLKPAPMAPST